MFGISVICRNILQRNLIFLKNISNKPKVILIPHLNEDVLDSVNKGEMSSKKHPGRSNRQLSILDEEIVDSIKKIIKDSCYKMLIKDARNYVNFIKSREPPQSLSNIQAKVTDCFQEVSNKMNVDLLSLDEDTRFKTEKKIQNHAYHLLKSRVYIWKPIQYTTYLGKQYLLDRMAPEYAILNKIFSEISQRYPDFKPHSLFDFGSGVGTVTWAARKYWENYLNEYFNVDMSPDMNEIARQLLTKGNSDPEAKLPIKNVFYRQFLPARSERKYSLVVSSFSLLELPSKELRLQTVMKLWNKTEDFLIIVELGNKPGFRVVLEARDFILDTESESKNPSGVHVFAPCPHDLDCPMTAITDKSCCFKASYERLPIGRTRNILNEYYSYIVLKKGKRPENDEQWPRLIYPVRKNKGRALCHLCTKSGNFRRYLFKKSTHGSMYFQFGRSTKPGDRLPISFTECDVGDFDNAVEVEDVEEGDELLDYDKDADYKNYE